MGNNQPANDKKQGLQDYERLGPVTIKQIPDPQGGQKLSIMQFSRPIESEKVLNRWNQQISKIEDSESRQILLLPDKQEFQKAGLCGSSGHVNLSYQNFPYVLDSQIKNRKKLNRHFLQTEMWYLLYNIIRAGNKFQKIGQKIGDVSPHNIIINDDGQIKVISTCSIPNQLNNFQKIVQDKNARVYLAPQQLNEQAIVKGIYPSNVDPTKAEVFSIGLTILSSGILEDCFDVYNKGFPRTINESIINQYLGILKQNYSPYLFTTVLNMLTFQPNQRKKSSQIYNQLYPHQYSILQLQPFSPPGIQPVVHQVPSQMRQSLNSQQGHPYFQNVQNSGYQTSGYPTLNSNINSTHVNSSNINSTNVSAGGYAVYGAPQQGQRVVYQPTNAPVPYRR